MRSLQIVVNNGYVRDIYTLKRSPNIRLKYYHSALQPCASFSDFLQKCYFLSLISLDYNYPVMIHVSSVLESLC